MLLLLSQTYIQAFIDSCVCVFLSEGLKNEHNPYSVFINCGMCE